MINPGTVVPDLVPYRAIDLAGKDFPEVPFIVPGLIPEGLTMLAGAPKAGKSFMMLQLGLAVPQGHPVFGSFQTNPSQVLYAALEDHERRMKARLNMLGQEIPDGLLLVHELPRINEGGAAKLQKWLRLNPDVKLVMIDTLAHIFPRDHKSNDYMDSTAALRDLRDVAHELGIAIVLVHHSRKMGADDAFDTILGSRGITATVDTMLVLDRARHQADSILQVTGRDIDEQRCAFAFNGGTWTHMGNAQMVDVTPERAALLAEVAEHGTTGIGPTALARALGDNKNNVQAMLIRATKDGQLANVGGRYLIADSLNY